MMIYSSNTIGDDSG